MDTLDHKFRNSKRRVAPPAVARFWTLDYEDVRFVCEHPANRVFTELPQAGNFADSEVLRSEFVSRDSTGV